VYITDIEVDTNYWQKVLKQFENDDKYEKFESDNLDKEYG